MKAGGKEVVEGDVEVVELNLVGMGDAGDVDVEVEEEDEEEDVRGIRPLRL